MSWQPYGGRILMDVTSCEIGRSLRSFSCVMLSSAASTERKKNNKEKGMVRDLVDAIARVRDFSVCLPQVAHCECHLMHVMMMI